MEVLYPRCCGIDVHKRFLVACLRIAGADGQACTTVRRFTTMTDDLLALADWLTQEGCTHVAMESTGVYWKPVYNILEDQLEVLVVNAAHMQAVPGRKTDVNDATWIADLLAHGLLRASFIPDKPHRELRELVRYRMALVHERTNEANRLQKVLEGGNITLASVASDVLGVSGRAIMAALASGSTDTAAMAELAKGRLRNKRAELERALEGRVSAHQRFMLPRQMAHIDALNGLIAEVSAEIAARLRPCEEAIVRLDTIPGIARQTAEVIVAEIGTDMTRFPTARHLASWAGLCPGKKEGGGKRLYSSMTKGNGGLRRMRGAACGGQQPRRRLQLRRAPAATVHRLISRVRCGEPQRWMRLSYWPHRWQR